MEEDDLREEVFVELEHCRRVSEEGVDQECSESLGGAGQVELPTEVRHGIRGSHRSVWFFQSLATFGVGYT